MKDTEKLGSPTRSPRERLVTILGMMRASLTNSESLDNDKLRNECQSLGGFKEITRLIRDADLLDPDGGNDDFDVFILAEKKANLKKRLDLWIDSLEKSGSAKDAISKVQEKHTNLGRLYKENVAKVLSGIRNVETYSRAVSSFYVNAGYINKNVYFLKASPKQITDIEGSQSCLSALTDELQDKYDRAKKDSAYATVVIPMYFGEQDTESRSQFSPSMVLKAYADMAQKYKTLLVTNYRDVKSLPNLQTEFPRMRLNGEDDWRSFACMVANWIVGRKAHSDVGEKEDLYIPPSLAVAGKMYANDLSQPASGPEPGQLGTIQGLRMDIRKSEAERLNKDGVICLLKAAAEEGSMYYASGSCTLNTTIETSKVEKRVYSVVRIKQTIEKKIQDIVDNEMEGKTLTHDNIGKIRSKIAEYLSQQGEKDRIHKPIEVPRAERGSHDETQVDVVAPITPVVPASKVMAKVPINLTKKAGEWSSDAKSTISSS